MCKQLNSVKTDTTANDTTPAGKRALALRNLLAVVDSAIVPRLFGQVIPRDDSLGGEVTITSVEGFRALADQFRTEVPEAGIQNLSTAELLESIAVGSGFIAQGLIDHPTVGVLYAEALEVLSRDDIETAVPNPGILGFASALVGFGEVNGR
jgi:hypothetical protein